MMGFRIPGKVLENNKKHLTFRCTCGKVKSVPTWKFFLGVDEDDFKCDCGNFLILPDLNIIELHQIVQSALKEVET